MARAVVSAAQCVTDAFAEELLLSRDNEEQRRQREMKMETYRQAKVAQSALDVECKRQPYLENVTGQDKKTASVATEVYDFQAPLPIPVPSGMIDRSTPDDWAEWWQRFPNGTGPLPHKETQQDPLSLFDFTPPGGKRHPGEHFVDVNGLLNAGLIRKEDVMRQRAFTEEELRAAMEALANHVIDGQIGC